MAKDARLLTRYEEKRDPSATPEPFGDAPDASTPTTRGSFVVHLHDATRAHYDLRLEIAGTLKSFAVPKGPTLDPEAKHLAVHTEDHPIEYLDFEDVIPEGQYGAGPMIVWDRGRVEYLESDAESGVEKGKLDFLLFGMKLKGRFALVKIKKGDKEWLLLKKRDGQDDATRDIQKDLPCSIVSGLTISELASHEEISAKNARNAEKIGISWKEHALSWIRPRIANSAIANSAGSRAKKKENLIVDVALGGIRVRATKDAHGVSIVMDDGSAKPPDVTAFYPELVRAMRALAGSALVLDGEIVSFDRAARPSLDGLRARLTLLRAGEIMTTIREHAAELVAFDVLRVGDFDVSGAPLAKRRALLRDLVAEVGFVRRAPDLGGDAAPLLALARSHFLPGVIVKSADDAYDAHAAWTFLEAATSASAFTVLDHGREGPDSVRHAKVTNRTKIFFPELGLTKGDLVDYYVQIAPFLLPYLNERPLVIVRYPDGIHGKSFFQWNMPAASPSWLRAIEVTSDDGRKKHAFVVEDVASLTHVANLGAIPLHVLAFREGARDLCDFFTIDFDVKDAGLARAIPIAKTLEKLLKQTGLEGFPKTSGQTGIHVLVPLGGGQTFDTAKMICELFGRLLVSAHPKDATMERITTKREGKVFIDVGQTGPSRTIVCPYSVRATKEATVSTALTWDEVTPDLDPTQFTMMNVPARLAKHGDPMRHLIGAQPDLERAITLLSKLIG